LKPKRLAKCALDAFEIIWLLLCTLQGLKASRELPSRNRPSRMFIWDDLVAFQSHFHLSRQLNTKAAILLLEHIINRESDELVWSALYDLLTDRKSTENSFTPDLYQDWKRNFFPDSLPALRQQMQDCVSEKQPYYARTLVFVQSSGMGKSRLADKFGESCPMINFILRDEDDGYPPADPEILMFTRRELVAETHLEMLTSESITSHRDSRVFASRRSSMIWNHSLAIGLLQASLEICKSCIILTIATYH